MRSTLPVLTVLVGLLTACGSSETAQRMPSVPVDDVLRAATLPAFRTMDADSFRKASVDYPASGGDRAVPVGDYLASRTAEVFPPAAEVDRLTLKRYDVACEEQGLLSSSVVCKVNASFSFRLYRRTREISYRLEDIDLGSRITPKAAAMTLTTTGSGADPFTSQIRRLVDASLKPMRSQVAVYLAEANDKLAF